MIVTEEGYCDQCCVCALQGTDGGRKDDFNPAQFSFFGDLSAVDDEIGGALEVCC